MFTLWSSRMDQFPHIFNLEIDPIIAEKSKSFKFEYLDWKSFKFGAFNLKAFQK